MTTLPPRSSPIDLAIYNPDLLSKEDLVDQFVARQGLLELLVEDLRRAGRSGGIQHHMLIGQRGMGKTTMLHRLHFAIEDDPELRKRWFPLSFPEEQYNITRMSDLWANCLDALGDMLDEQGREEEAKQLDELIKNLPNEEEQRSRAAQDQLTLWAEREGKGLVLLLDNAEQILSRLAKHHWELREALSHNDRLVFIGASPAYIPAVYEYEGAFYDFFSVREMRGLNLEETRTVLLKLAELRRAPHVAEIVKTDPARIKALQVLTGGNTRVLIVLFQVLAQERDSSVLSELEQILDLHTPHYKAIIESLSTQAQQIVDAMALHWDPITAAELAALPTVRLETNVVSAQLDRLTRDGVVEKAPTPAGEKLLYQVAERFFNIWYLMRASRRLRRRLIWLVDFLKMFYAPTDLYNRAHRFLRSEPIKHRAEMAFAYAQTVDDAPMRHALEYEGIRFVLSDHRERRKALHSMLDFETDDALLKTHAERIAELHDIRERVLNTKVQWPGCTAEEFWQRLGGSWALTLEEKKKIADRLDVMSEEELRDSLNDAERKQRRLFDLLGMDQMQKLRYAIGSGDMADLSDVEGAAIAAIRLDSPSLKIIAQIERAREKYPPPSMDEIEQIRQSISAVGDSVYTWYEMGNFLSKNPDLRGEAEAHHRKALEAFPNDPYLWYGLGNLLGGHLNRYEEAEDAYRKATQLAPNFAWPWTAIGNLMTWNFKRYDEAEKAYRKAIELDPNSDRAWVSLGNLLSDHLNRLGEAENAYRKIVEINSTSAWSWNQLGDLLKNNLKYYDKAEVAYRKATEIDPGISVFWNDLGNLLSDQLKRYDEAEAAYRKPVEIDPSSARRWVNLGNSLRDHLNLHDKAEAAYRKAIEIDPKDVWLWSSLGNLLSDHFKRYDEAEAAYRKPVEIDPSSARRWVNFGNSLRVHLKRHDKAEAAYRKAIEIDPKDAHAWSALGALFHYDLKRYGEAESTYQKAIEIDPNYESAWDNLGNLLSYHLNQFEEAEAAYRKAIEINPGQAWYWCNLGNLLYRYLNRFDEAEAARRKAVELSPNDAHLLNNLAWALYSMNRHLSEAEEIARKASVSSKDDLYIIGTLAWILARLGKWDEASQWMRRIIAEGSDDFFDSIWPDILDLCRDVVKTGHAEDFISLLDETGYSDRWRPLREALRAIAAGSDAPLLRVAPEIRQPAEELVAQLLPEGVRLESAIQAAREKKTRRKKNG